MTVTMDQARTMAANFQIDTTDAGGRPPSTGRRTPAAGTHTLRLRDGADERAWQSETVGGTQYV